VCARNLRSLAGHDYHLVMSWGAATALCSISSLAAASAKEGRTEGSGSMHLDASRANARRTTALTPC
jgi:hypothetical protein